MNQQGITDPTLLSNPRMILPQQSEIIYEIYIQAKNAIAEDLLIWLDTVLIKDMLSYEGFRAAKLFTLINDDSKNRTKNYTYYSVQFLVDSIDLLNNYLTNYGDKFRLDAAAIYGKQFTEERRILSFQKFYTYDSTFNPNTNTVTNVSSNPILTTEPIANPQDTPVTENKKGIMADLKSFFGFNRKREANLFVDNSNVGNLAPNVLLAKNVSQPFPAQSAGQIQSGTNLANRDKNLYFAKDDDNLNPPSGFSNNNVNVGNENLNNNPNLMLSSNLSNEACGQSGINNSNLKDNLVYDANNPNQNLNVNRDANLNLQNTNNNNLISSSNQNPQDLTFSSREPIKSTNLTDESHPTSDLQSKNIIYSNEPQKEFTSTTSNISNREANLGSFPNNPITDFSQDYSKKTDIDREYPKRQGEKGFNYDKDYVFGKDFLESVQSTDKDFPRKDINRDLNYDYTKNNLNKETYVGAYDNDLNKNLKFDYGKYKDKNKEDVIVEQTTKIKDINDNQKYISRDIYIGTVDKDKLQHLEKDLKTDIFSSPSNRDYSDALDYENKENDLNLVNRIVKDQERFGIDLGKHDYLQKDVHNYSTEKQRVSGQGKK